MTAIDAIRRPEFTGRNRCWPCTVLNTLLLGITVAVLGLVSLPVALVVGAGGATVIWLRGYLVPYTPRFAPRIADRLPVGFKQSPGGDRTKPDDRSGTLAGADPSDPEAVLETLIDGGVLVADGDGVFLSDSFQAAWDGECATLSDRSAEDLATAAVEAAPGDPDATVHEIDEGQWIQLGSGKSVVDEDDVLLSRPVVVAEVGAIRALEAADVDLDAETMATAANALRAFRDTCPVCGTALVESSTADCCGGQKADPRPVSRCPECDAAIYTFPED